MSSGLDLFDEQADAPRPRGRRDRRRRRARLLLGAILFGVVAAATWFGVQQILGFGMFGDYDGAGERDVLIEVRAGDSIGAIGGKLAEADVVATSRSFVSASEDNSAVAGVQPGYYVMKTRMSGELAAERIVDPETRVGQLEIRAGTQLDDITQPNDEVTKGIYSLLADASCAELNGQSTCVSAEDLRQTVADSGLADLGAPEWAVGPAEQADPERWLEGLVVPGVYDLRPGWSAERILRTVLEESATTLQAWGLPKLAEDNQLNPYETLVVASLIEREGIAADFGKISRVIYNRLEDGTRLQFDSTVNYALDRPQVRTNPEDRARAGPYNTYDSAGLPPTPIASPSQAAVQAAAEPEEGSWMYFVKCYKDGKSCFAETNQEHNQNRREAQARGAY
ncbi:UPF0755 protein [Tamaricihabitans halophyticus]|uniref:Endolytic murein transglycosylase n=1 Tax=Tamaricihabitans halophyticus TaxID=1262583 RepID=A0A4R2QCG3_9PSEU|nr:endolytic transglycosylase MltG [Tamaricihabitans halophyticus]TCP46279.1 UPF0755 protein [Tamaricihabitans halophyticus]